MADGSDGARRRVYVSGPITLGDRQHNLDQANAAGRELIDRGFAPWIPHLTMHFPGAWEIDHEVWVQVDLPWVAMAEAVLRLPGVSRGADRECDFAHECGVPVFHSIDKIAEYFTHEQQRD